MNPIEAIFIVMLGKTKPLAEEQMRFDRQEITCLAQNVYFEARNEPMDGQYAVAHVAKNRKKHKDWPDTLCKVIWQNKQFSWTQDGKSDEPRNKRAWLRAMKVAKDVYRNKHEDNTDGSLFYHASYVSPYWSGHYKLTMVIGEHIFYTKKDNNVN